MKSDKAKRLCMIIRGERSVHHKAPFHPVILVTRKHTYEWEVGDCTDGVTAVELNINSSYEHPTFHLLRYKGYINDSNKHFKLFDGTDTKEFLKSEYLKECLKKAIWWSDQEPPEWLKPNFAEDDFTKESIEADMGTCLLPNSQEEKLLERKEKYQLPKWLKPSNRTNRLEDLV